MEGGREGGSEGREGGREGGMKGGREGGKGGREGRDKYIHLFSQVNDIVGACKYHHQKYR